MGRRGTAPALVMSSAGYFVAPPPVTRERMAEIFGAPLPDDAWLEVETAFERFQANLVHGNAAVRAADYKKGRRKAEQDITAAFEAAKAHVGSETTRSMEKAVSRGTPEGVAGKLDCDISGHLAKAAEHLGLALRAIRQAEPVPMPIPTAPQAKVFLARQLRDILNRAGLPVHISDRRSLPHEPAAADLTPFERLVSEAELHVANSRDALAKWVAEALRKGAHET